MVYYKYKREDARKEGRDVIENELKQKYKRITLLQQPTRD
jgi:hypothetical protein